jgi:aminomethyltransferase
VDDASLRHSPLEERHRELGAKLGPFGGWLMPIEYQGVLSEHSAVRERVGLFDLSHLGKVDVAGAGAVALLQGLLTNDVGSIEAGRAQYNLLLNDEGGIEEDLLVYRLAEDRFFLVPNAANTDMVTGTLRADGEGVEVVQHDDWCFLGVQGPRAGEVAGTLFAESGDLAYLGVAEIRFREERLVLARTGYTGELGFELFTTASSAGALWEELVEAGDPFLIEPCGLGARDVLRLEMGYALCGQDLSPDRTPLEAGLSWAVAMDKGPFRGREALVRQRADGVPSRLRGIVMQDRRHIPRAHHAVLADGVPAGEVTSGTFSPLLQRGIAMGYLAPADSFGPGSAVEVDVRGRRGPATIVKPAFVDRSPR